MSDTIVFVCPPPFSFVPVPCYACTAGSLWGSVILLFMLLSLMLQLAGAMKLAGIEVNAGTRLLVF